MSLHYSTSPAGEPFGDVAPADVLMDRGDRVEIESLRLLAQPVVNVVLGPNVDLGWTTQQRSTR
jgi:hypothetical protein